MQRKEFALFAQSRWATKGDAVPAGTFFTRDYFEDRVRVVTMCGLGSSCEKQQGRKGRKVEYLRTLPEAPGLTTRSKDATGAPGIATRSKDATTSCRT